MPAAPPPPITDCHTHAFPDDLAARAIPALAAAGGVAPSHDGTIAGLLGAMDAAGIGRAVVCSIATRPSQFEAILSWSQSIASDRIVPLASIHPDDPNPAGRVAQVAAAGLAGLKVHPYYQEFALDDPRAMAIYAAAADHGLLVTCHCGYDLAFPYDDRAAPARVQRVIDALPQLRFVATHCGGWRAWDEVEALLLGRPLDIEISMTLGWTEPERVRRLLLGHDPGRLLFGSDAPWSEPAEALQRLAELDLPAGLLDGLLRRNAARLLGF